MSSTKACYPTPSIVIGMGRFGLSVLELLAEDWEWLKQCGGDDSLRNLSLIHLYSPDKSDEFKWRKKEEATVKISKFIGAGDRPSRTLDFCILRCLGLIRYRNGQYQIAHPKDRGIQEKESKHLGQSHKTTHKSNPARRRFFDWHSLSHDPIEAVEALPDILEDEPELAHFISPLLNRIRQGHSPMVIMCCISRSLALAQGRDPSPWKWTHQLTTSQKFKRRALATLVKPYLEQASDGQGKEIEEWITGRSQSAESPAPVMMALQREVNAKAPSISSPPTPQTNVRISSGRFSLAQWLLSRPEWAWTLQALTQEEQYKLRDPKLSSTPEQFDDLVPELSTLLEIPIEKTWLPNHSLASHTPIQEIDLLMNFAPDPVDQWSRLLYDWSNTKSISQNIHLTTTFTPLESDLTASLDLQELLRSDWATTHWVQDRSGQNADELTRLGTIPTTDFRLGLFDLCMPPSDQEHAQGLKPSQIRHEHLRARLEKLSTEVHRGLVRLWMDLQLQYSPLEAHNQRSELSGEKTKLQTLELLSELVIRPLQSSKISGKARPGISKSSSNPQTQNVLNSQSSFVSRSMSARSEAKKIESSTDLHDPYWIQNLPTEASAALRQMELPVSSESVDISTHLLKRLKELGHENHHSPDQNQDLLLSEVTLHPEDIDPASTNSHHEASNLSKQTHKDNLKSRRNKNAKTKANEVLGINLTEGARKLRKEVNVACRRLLDFSHLRSYRDEITRQSPRVSIYIVADLSECFARTTLQFVIKELHAELLRAFGPIFPTYLTGYDRSLSILPVLWTPQPSDPFGDDLGHGGEHQGERACQEEIVILDTIHQVRRWIEMMPNEAVCVPQIYLNGRVTGNAVLQSNDTLLQSRNFLNLLLRNDSGKDETLQLIASFQSRRNLFASFNCHTIEFSAERSRDYLANALARDCLTHFSNKDATPPQKHNIVRAPSVQELCRSPLGKLNNRIDKRREELLDPLQADEELAEGKNWRDIESKFSAEAAKKLDAQILEFKNELLAPQGEVGHHLTQMDQQLVNFERTHRHDIPRQHDQLIREQLTQTGFNGMRRFFAQRQKTSQGCIDESLRELKHRQRIKVQDKPSGLEEAFACVTRAAQRVPDDQQLWLGFWTILLMGLLTGAPLSYGVSLFFELHKEPSLLEAPLWTMSFIIGAIVIAVPTGFGLMQHKKATLQKVRLETDEVGRVLSLAMDQQVAQAAKIRVETHAALLRWSVHSILHRLLIRDVALLDRIGQSINLQKQTLLQKVERMGVLEKPQGDRPHETDDTRKLFERRGVKIPQLIDPGHLTHKYREVAIDPRALENHTQQFIDFQRDLVDWRTQAILSDTDRCMKYGRKVFEDLTKDPIGHQTWCTDHVIKNLDSFVRFHYPNTGFGAQFTGYEGFDPDGIERLAEAKIFAPKPLRKELLNYWNKHEKKRPIETKSWKVSPNSAVMLCLAQKLHPLGIHNFQRYESYAERDDLHLHSLRPEEHHSQNSKRLAPLNALSGHADLATTLHETMTRTKERVNKRRTQGSQDQGG